MYQWSSICGALNYVTGQNIDYSGESSDRKEESYTEASNISENTYIIMNKTLVEMWTLRMLLVKSQLETKNLLLEIEGDRQWLRTRLNCQKGEHVSYDIRYLAQKVSKQSVEGTDMFFWSNRWTEKELLSKKEWEIKDLENVQPILQKLRISILEGTPRMWHRAYRPRGQGSSFFFQSLRLHFHRVNQAIGSSQRAQGIRQKPRAGTTLPPQWDQIVECTEDYSQSLKI